MRIPNPNIRTMPPSVSRNEKSPSLSMWYTKRTKAKPTV
eukprot:CAMPEP_0184074208 /NCGR_PEP_ID=MMETSP0957-20130417/67776_1 /TAXON_ID=627963 /ORGANISM="Aplanochytrium sp, Strain PBS07" /LENGTH=38 /DNA_ID= /DNA_START= /DNA_END= /DNA_ORIENTATION=